MTTATTTAAKSAKSAVNGASRQVKAIRRKAASQAHELQADVMREGRALAKRAGQLYASASRATRQHPWTAAGIVAASAALIGGYLWASRQR